MFRELLCRSDQEDNYHFDAEELAQFKARTMGCNCCSSIIYINNENLDEHIKSLEFELEKAKAVKYALNHKEKDGGTCGC